MQITSPAAIDGNLRSNARRATTALRTHRVPFDTIQNRDQWWLSWMVLHRHRITVCGGQRKNGKQTVRQIEHHTAAAEWLLTSQSISLVTIPPLSGRSLRCSVSLSPSLYVAISCWVVASRWMCWTRLTTVASGWNDYGRMGFDAGDGMGLNDSLPGIERKTTQSTLEGSWEVEYSDARNRYRSPELRSISHLSMMNLLCFLKSSCLQLSFH